jgi:hypothetical protein
MIFLMKRSCLLALAAVSFVSAAACSKAPAEGSGGAGSALANDLRGAPVAKGGIPDDSIRPVVGAPLPGKPTVPVAKGGVPDDSVKPVTLPKPAVAKGAVADDGVKPAPR